MSRTSNTILMLNYLQSGRIYKISELVEKLEADTREKINPRNIVEYRKELELAGYHIIIHPGKYGGYQLDKTKNFPALKFTENEKKSLMEVYQILNSKNNFMNKNVIDSAFGKILSNVNYLSYDTYLSFNQYQLLMSTEDLEKRYAFIKDCIEKKKEIEIKYASLKSGLKMHILHPYQLFLRNGRWFFFAWDLEASDVWSFKLNRIKEYKKTGNTFTVWKNFNPKNQLDEHGYRKDGNWEEIELIATGIQALLFQERSRGKNQQVTIIDENTVKVSFKMQNKSLITSFILSAGDNIKVLKPQWLIDEIKEVSKKVIKNYED